jgi:hypothetical protein
MLTFTHTINPHAKYINKNSYSLKGTIHDWDDTVFYVDESSADSVRIVRSLLHYLTAFEDLAVSYQTVTV